MTTLAVMMIFNTPQRLHMQRIIFARNIMGIAGSTRVPVKLCPSEIAVFSFDKNTFSSLS
jgi:hypothetical protein